MEKDYPSWVCTECGMKAQKDHSRFLLASTYHTGRCEVCGLIKPVTEPRDFGYPDFKQLK